jgi:ketosteroid isomerase-like protein
VIDKTADVLDELREAARAINEGDNEPFLALFDENTEWRGATSRLLWWKDTPSCHGAVEARAVVETSNANRQFPRQVDPEFTQIGEDAVLSVTRLVEGGGTSRDRFHVFIFGDGRIREMRAFKDRKSAERFAKGSGRQGSD